MLLTLNQVISQITTLGAAHLQIQSTGVGDFAEWQALERAYPLLWVFHESTSVGDRELVYSIRLVCADRVITGEEGDDTAGMEQEVLSDTLLILLDFLAYFQQQHAQSYKVITNASIDPFTERFNDRVAGNSVLIQIRQPFTWDACQIPQTGAIIPPSVDGLTLYDFCDPSVIARLTPSQVACLEAEYGIPCLDGNIKLNGVQVATVAAGGIEDVDVVNGGSNPVGSWDGTSWVIGNNYTEINGVQVTDQEAEVNASIAVTLDGSQSGIWNAGLQTWQVTSLPCAPVTFQINGVTKESPASGTTFNLITKLDGAVNSGSYDAPTDTLAFTSTGGWIRPSDWITMPTLTASDERFYGIVAVFENRYNVVGVTLNGTSSNIDWGDGTLSVVSNGGLMSKVYNYASLTGDVNVWPTGENYKQVLVDITRVGVAITSMDWITLTSVNYYGGNNFIDINMSLPSLTTCNISIDPLSGSKGMTMLQRLRIWSVATLGAQLFRGLKSLRVVQFPATFQGSFTNAFLNGGEVDDCGNMNFGTSTAVVNFWAGTGLKKHGNYTANSVVGNGTNYVSGCGQLTQFGAINATLQTSFDSFFYEDFTLMSVGLITAPAATNLGSMFFRNTILGSTVFSDCSLVTVTTSMYGNCVGLFDSVMPGLTRGVNFTGTAMANYGMNRFANSIGTASGAQTITITGTPFGALVTAADATALAIRLVMTGKGYTIVN